MLVSVSDRQRLSERFKSPFKWFTICARCCCLNECPSFKPKQALSGVPIRRTLIVNILGDTFLEIVGVKQFRAQFQSNPVSPTVTSRFYYFYPILSYLHRCLEFLTRVVVRTGQYLKCKKQTQLVFDLGNIGLVCEFSTFYIKFFQPRAISLVLLCSIVDRAILLIL